MSAPTPEETQIEWVCLDCDAYGKDENVMFVVCEVHVCPECYGRAVRRRSHEAEDGKMSAHEHRSTFVTKAELQRLNTSSDLTRCREKLRGAEVLNAELLEALKRLHGEIQSIRHDLGTNYPALSEAWVLAGAIIAKAEGRK